jgi:hypothetical protein
VTNLCHQYTARQLKVTNLCHQYTARPLKVTNLCHHYQALYCWYLHYCILNLKLKTPVLL